jgi:hypothetical protein
MVLNQDLYIIHKKLKKFHFTIDFVKYFYYYYTGLIIYSN